TSGLSEKDKAFIAALEEKGVTPSSPDIALSIGSYVCQSVQAGGTRGDLRGGCRGRRGRVEDEHAYLASAASAASWSSTSCSARS
ncbi:DUF732 domain-containing protein, partial [Nocardia farcinica]|uniref:DUF732 domain-containing protein n=1 Tax=Nocardia farcinica TaxID=37329 RepID=UPI002455373D